MQSCHNFPAGSRQATRGACICETSLLWDAHAPRMPGTFSRLQRKPLISNPGMPHHTWFFMQWNFTAQSHIHVYVCYMYVYE